jgi:hypothetical protein
MIFFFPALPGFVAFIDFDSFVVPGPVVFEGENSLEDALTFLPSGFCACAY